MQLFDIGRRCAATTMAVVAGIAVATQIVAAPTAGASPAADPFYGYDAAALADIAPGAVLKTRVVDFHLAGIPLPIKVTQLLYRTTTALGAPAATVTSVMKPLVPTAQTRLVSYQSAYDSLSPNCEPSYNVAGGFLDDPLGSGFTGESGGVIALLTQGYTVLTSDFEGQRPDFGVGPQAGMGVLDGIRAALNSPEVGLPSDVPVGMLGYSGGGIGTEWASEMAPDYAPDVNAHLVGAAAGGLPVDPIHNLKYASGSLFWSTVIPMAVVGASRAYGIDMTPYLSDYGKRITDTIQDGCIDKALLNGGPLLTWQQLVKPEYARPESIPAFVHAVNKLIMGTGGTPTAPLYIAQGTLGELEGTLTKPDIGPGDGIMVAADSAGLAQEYCDRGVTVQYEQYPVSHGITGAVWALKTLGWMADRFNGVPAPQNCGSLPPGTQPQPIPES
ncbi:lipase family protein [Nocardia sp. NPDC059240]|uniref:lipase family protein n=1 Tax=Nocardia sp. NPDC059240 TaxID=3346786 RepID=UPI0036B19FD5